MAEIAQSQRKFISQQNSNEHPMLVGTPPSLPNDHDSIEPGASATSFPVEPVIDYECCVCRTTKSDSQSPIGLIGTSCLSLCKSFLEEVLDDGLIAPCSTQPEIDAIKWVPTESLPIRLEHHDFGNVSAKNEAMPSADQWTPGKIEQRNGWVCIALIFASTSLISVKTTTISVPCWFNRVDTPSMPIVSPLTSKRCIRYVLSRHRWTQGCASTWGLESRGCRSIEQTDASFEYELSLSTVPSIGEHVDSSVRCHGLLRRSRTSLRTDSPRSSASSHATSDPSETSAILTAPVRKNQFCFFCLETRCWWYVFTGVLDQSRSEVCDQRTTLTGSSDHLASPSVDETTRRWIRLWHPEVVRFQSETTVLTRLASRAQLVHEQLFYESASRVDQKNIRKSFYSNRTEWKASGWRDVSFSHSEILHDLHHLGYPFHHQHLWQELTGLSCPATIPE